MWSYYVNVYSNFTLRIKHARQYRLVPGQLTDFVFFAGGFGGNFYSNDGYGGNYSHSGSVDWWGN